jgi:hypothetical protein
MKLGTKEQKKWWTQLSGSGKSFSGAKASYRLQKRTAKLDIFNRTCERILVDGSL